MGLNKRLVRKDARKGLAQGGPMQRLGAPLSGLSPCANTRTPQVSQTRGRLLGPERIRKPKMARIDVDVICVAGHEVHCYASCCTSYQIGRGNLRVARTEHEQYRSSVSTAIAQSLQFILQAGARDETKVARNT
jgi:hypothetical protein